MKADEIKMEVATEPIEIRMPRFKKTRRGKKRRLNTDDEANNPSHSPPPNNHDGKGDSYKNLTPEKMCPHDGFAEPTPEGATTGSVTWGNSGGFKRLMLRPLDVPKAPSNSTQFIMDDHENCNLYLSFESPRRRRSSGSEGCSDDFCHSPCTGYRDIDYEYESPDDLDTTAFFEKDFENIYRRAREDGLMDISRMELIGHVMELENRVSGYEQLLKGILPSVAQLQEELLKMQEDNLILQETNWCLKNGSARNASNATDSDLGESDLCLSMEESDAPVESCVRYGSDQEGASLQDPSIDP